MQTRRTVLMFRAGLMSTGMLVAVIAAGCGTNSGGTTTSETTPVTGASTPNPVAANADVFATAAPGSPKVGALSGSINVSGTVAGLMEEPHLVAVAYRNLNGSWYPAQTYTVTNGTYSLSVPDGAYRLGFFDLKRTLQASFYQNAARLETASDIEVETGALAPGSLDSVTLEPPKSDVELRIVPSAQSIAPPSDQLGLIDLLAPVALAAPLRQVDAEEGVSVGIEADGTHMVYPSELPIPLNGRMEITHTVRCQQQTATDGDLTLVSAKDASTTRLFKDPCNSASCKDTERSMKGVGANLTRIHWSIPLSLLTTGVLSDSWACPIPHPDNDPTPKELAQIVINDPSGRATTGISPGASEVPGLTVELFDTGALPGGCTPSNVNPTPTSATGSPANRWHPDWSGFSPVGTGGSSQGTYVTGAGSSPSSGYYGWAGTPDRCYYVVMSIGNVAACPGTKGSSTTPNKYYSPIIGYAAAREIQHLDFNCK